MPAELRAVRGDRDAGDTTLADRVMARLLARLDPGASYPLAVAFSGGGDSVALLDLVASWARTYRRSIVALTVDHRLHPDSPEWTRKAQALAHRLGCQWQGLTWERPTPGVGLTARARAARHALLADAARSAGARVLLFAQTRDDRLEADWMRSQEGASIGNLREWSPSPAWPQGRGMMLFRPLLDEGREALRRHLRLRSLDWIEDPANADLRFGRSRARQALAGREGHPLSVPVSDDLGSLPEVDDWGLVTVSRQVQSRVLASALVVASGGQRLPRRQQVERLRSRLQTGEVFSATLLGSRLTATDKAVQIGRQWAPRSGQVPPDPVPLDPEVPVFWDGRFEVWTDIPGQRVTAARGLLGRLTPPDRRALAHLPPWHRASQPVLIGNDANAPVLARPGVNQRSWMGHRLILALDQMTREDQIDTMGHGARAGDTLFSRHKR